MAGCPWGPPETGTKRCPSTAVTTGSTSYPKWGLSFTYDRYGNRTAQTVTAGTAYANSVVVSATTNNITTSGYTYDLNGNLTNDGVNAIAYDGENRLVSSTGSAGAGTYSYRASGLRTVKVSGGTTTVYIFDGNRDIAEYTNGTLANEYIYWGDKTIASYLNGTLYYHASDHQSIRVHLDTIGNILGQKGQYSFGEDWYPSSFTNRHFTTYERDLESSNDNALHRFYVNRLGRFSANDPLASGGQNPQGSNLYSYVHNDPVNRLDPSGREDCDPLDDIRTSTCGCDNLLSFPCPTGGPEGGGGGSGGGGGNCNPDGVEGSSCPPENPTPPPPFPTPACSLEVKYHPIKLIPFARHTFWYITGAFSVPWIFTAGPQPGHQFPNFGYLTGDAEPGPTLGRNKSSDKTYAPYHFGPDPKYCANAYLMTALALNFKDFQGTEYRYKLFGPNSNSFTHSLGVQSGLPVTPIGPPRAVGWIYLIFFIP